MSRHPLEGLGDDIRDHIERETAENIERGMSPDEARLAARRTFGSTALTEDQTRDVWTTRWLQALVQDTRYAVRSLKKNPGFATVAILTLALGIGANTAIFSIINAVLIRPLPYHDAERLFVVEPWRQLAGRLQRTNYSIQDLAAWSQNSRALESVALSYSGVQALDSPDGAEMLNSIAVSSGFFSTMQGRMAFGRPLGAADDRLPVVVISERLWSRRFSRSPQVIGTMLSLSTDGRTEKYTVVGVVDDSFQYPSARADLWIPSGFYATVVNPSITTPGYGGFNVILRLRSGATLEQGRADAEHVSAVLNPSRDRSTQIDETNVIELKESLIGGVRPALLVLLAAVVLVLLVACINVANLSLARGGTRSREFLTRQALGASRLRLIAQALVEAGVLTMVGGLAAVVVADLAVQVISWLGPAAGMPRSDTINLDGRTLACTAFLAGVATLAAGLLPAILASQPRVGLSPGVGPASRHVMAALVIGEVAVSTMLLVGSSLLGRSLVKLMASENLGIRTENVIAGEMNLQMGRGLDSPHQVSLVDNLISNVSALPGVVAAGVGNGIPPNGARMRGFMDHLDPATGMPRQFNVDFVPATSGYFKALTIPLLAGRSFEQSDRTGGPSVMIVSETAAREFFGKIDVVGETLRQPRAEGEQGDIRIIGVVGDVKYSGMATPSKSVIYRPFQQYPFKNFFMTVRMVGDPALAIASVRRAVADTDPEITISNLRPLDSFVAEAAAEPRFRTASLMILSGLACALALIGLYGMVAYAVSRRMVEIGVRVALGATYRGVVGMILREAMRLAIIGCVTGIIAAYALSRLLTAFLYGVAATDPTSFAGATAALVIMALIASLIPALRATRIDPIVALRCE